MQQQNDILIYILEHLGLPLMQASSVLNAQDKKVDAEACASTMAKLLSASVQLGMAYSSKLNVPSDPDKGELIRFKLTSLAASALLGRISLTKKDPSEADINMLKSASDSLMAFSDNFSLNERTLELLKSLELDLFSGDEISYLHMVDSMLPVIECVRAKPLEGDAAQLLQHIVGKLHADSQEVVAVLVEGSATDLAAQKAFSVLSKIFASIYRDAVIQKQSLAFVWDGYATQKELALVLLKYLVTGKTEATPSSLSPQQPETSSSSYLAEETTHTPQPQSPAAPPSSSQVIEESQTHPSATSASGSPSIFSKPSGQETQSAQSPISPLHQEQQAVPSQPVEASQPPHTETTEGETSTETGGSPLSFFKKSDS